MRKGIKFIIFVILIVTSLLYVWRYQISGYTLSVKFDDHPFTVSEVEHEFSIYANQHGRWALRQLSIQEIIYSPNKICAEYSDDSGKYILTMIYTPNNSKLSVMINRSSKLFKPPLQLSKWKYDIDDFILEIGNVSGYTVNGIWNGDKVYFRAGSTSYSANPFTGDIIEQRDDSPVV